ncbi:hypothetical protein GEMRC1_011429 [Eukaryota sp. GEM-RC1]
MNPTINAADSHASNWNSYVASSTAAVTSLKSSSSSPRPPSSLSSHRTNTSTQPLSGQSMDNCLSSLSIPVVKTPSFASTQKKPDALPKTKPMPTMHSKPSIQIPSSSKTPTATPASPSMPPTPKIEVSSVDARALDMRKPKTPAIPKKPIISKQNNYKSTSVDTFVTPSSPKCPPSRHHSQSGQKSLRSAQSSYSPLMNTVKSDLDNADRLVNSSKLVSSSKLLKESITQPKNVTSLQHCQNLESFRSQQIRHADSNRPGTRGALELEESYNESKNSSFGREFSNFPKISNPSQPIDFSTRSISRTPSVSTTPRPPSSLPASPRPLGSMKPRELKTEVKGNVDPLASLKKFTIVNDEVVHPRRVGQNERGKDQKDESKMTVINRDLIGQRESLQSQTRKPAELNSSFSYRIGGQSVSARRSIFGFRDI